MEEKDIMCTWKAWSKDEQTAKNNFIPISIIYTPLFCSVPVLEHSVIECNRCKAVINIYDAVDKVTKVYKCSICDNFNQLPPSFSGNVSASNTIEYVVPQDKYSSYIIFVIDIASDFVADLKNTLLQVVNTLPSDVNISIITYSKHIYVHDFQYDYVKCIAIRGDKEYNIAALKELLLINHNVHKFFAKPTDFNFISTLENLSPDARLHPGARKERCTGSVLNVSIQILKLVGFRATARIVNFVAGACTVGKGKVVGLSLSESIRSFSDIKKKNPNTIYLEPAKEYYKGLGVDASKAGISVDIFSGSIDQCGLYEMEPLCQSTGGYLLLFDSYSSGTFKSTLKSFFNSNWSLYGDCTLSVRCTANIKICGCISLGHSLNNRTEDCSSLETGLSNTNSWGISSINPNTSFTVFFNPYGITTDSYTVQFKTTYFDHEKNYRIRIATQKYFVSDNPLQDFQQEAAAVVTSKIVAWKLLTEEISDVVQWLDKSLIGLTKKFSSIQNKNVLIPKQISMYPQFMYYMRRSQFLNRFNVSPDESAYYRQGILRGNVTNTLLMIQPVLLSYSFDSDVPVPKLLQASSFSSDSILLLDTFFNVVIWHGKQICKWKELEYDKNPEYANFKQLLSMPDTDAEFITNSRFPVPRQVYCSPGKGDERLIKARLDTQTSALDGESILSEVMSLEVFIKKLKEYVLN